MGWEQLAQTVHDKLVSMHTLVPTRPADIVAKDASKHGMAGFWLPKSSTTNLPPVLWSAPFHPDIQHQL